MNQSLHYQEITCLPDHEISVGFVMGKVMDIVHLALVNASKAKPSDVTSGSTACPIGISFPEYRDGPSQDRGVPIGGKLRLFAQSEADLMSAGLITQLERVRDYVHVTSVRPLQRRVTMYACYQRRQPKSSRDRLIRRQMSRQGITQSEAAAQYETFQPHQSRLPYVNLRSHSTGERFRLFIDRSEKPTPTGGAWGFSTYGLSGQVAVPEF